MIGSPKIKISFEKLVRNAGKKAGTGVVLMLLKDSADNGLHILRSAEEIPSGLSEDNKKYIKQCFIGGSNEIRTGEYLERVALTPSQVIVHVAGVEADLTKELANLEDKEFNIFCMPGAQELDIPKITAFIDKMNGAGVACMAVVSSKSVNNANIINFKTNLTVAGESVTPDKYVARIAGIIAGVPLAQSVTYQVLDEVKAPTTDNSTADTAINKGELIVMNISGKPRIARGVTSLVSEDEEEPFRKIKLKRIYNFINNSIRKVLVNEYLGKVPNTFDNKVLLCSAIKTGLLDEMVKEGLLAEGSLVDIDVNKQKAYLKQIGKNVDSMSDEEVRKANTNSRVFLKIHVSAIDAMEDFDIAIGI